MDSEDKSTEISEEDFQHVIGAEEALIGEIEFKRVTLALPRTDSTLSAWDYGQLEDLFLGSRTDLVPELLAGFQKVSPHLARYLLRWDSVCAERANIRFERESLDYPHGIFEILRREDFPRGRWLLQFITPEGIRVPHLLDYILREEGSYGSAVLQQIARRDLLAARSLMLPLVQYENELSARLLDDLEADEATVVYTAEQLTLRTLWGRTALDTLLGLRVESDDELDRQKLLSLLLVRPETLRECVKGYMMLKAPEYRAEYVGNSSIKYYIKTRDEFSFKGRHYYDRVLYALTKKFIDCPAPTADIIDHVDRSGFFHLKHPVTGDCGPPGLIYSAHKGILEDLDKAKEKLSAKSGLSLDAIFGDRTMKIKKLEREVEAERQRSDRLTRVLDEFANRDDAEGSGLFDDEIYGSEKL